MQCVTEPMMEVGIERRNRFLDNMYIHNYKHYTFDCYHALKRIPLFCALLKIVKGFFLGQGSQRA